MAVETDIPALSLADQTALFSKVLRERPELQGNRAVDLFIQDCIEVMRDAIETPASQCPENGTARPAS